MRGWQLSNFQGGIQGGLAILIVPMAIGAYLNSVPGLGEFPYAILPIACAVLAIALFWKGRPNSGVFSLIALYLCGEIFTGTPLDVVYSSLYVSAIWMAFGCFVLGVAVTHCGLTDRLAQWVIVRSGTSYVSLIIGLVLIGFLLSFLVPTAVARIFLLLPIIIALADKLGYHAHSRGRTGLLFAGIIGTLVPSYAILPATVSGIVLQGSAEKLFSIEFSYGDYFIANFPALALPATIVAILLLICLFHERPSVQPATKPASSLNSREVWTLLIGAAAVIMWASDQIHRLPVTWIALAAATACLLPVIGPLRDVSVFRFMRARTWVLLIGVMGAVTLFNMTGLGETVSAYVVDWLALSRAASGSNYAVLVLLAMIVSVVVTSQAAPAVFATLAKDMGLATGWPIEGILMAQVAAWVFLVLPYAIPALLIGLRACGLRYRHVMSFAVLYFVIGALAILPLQFWWLHQLGYIP
jgi:di/tricarboxylate transporter